MRQDTGLAQPSVGVLVVTWNGAETVRACLTSLQAVHYAAYRICLVDNGSRPGFAESLASEFPDVEVLTLPHNLGYAGGCNAGLRWAREQGLDYALILNDDTTADPELIGALVARAEQVGGSAIVAPQILKTQQPNLVWSAGGLIRRPWFKADHIGAGENRTRYREAREVEWASGCALLVPLSVIDTVGPMDDRYFLYLEDVEWCLRMRRHGISVWYEPKALLWHDVSASVRSMDDRIVRYYSYRNYYLLAFTHTGVAGRLWFGLHFATTFLKIAIRTALFPSYRRSAWYHARTRAMVDFLRGRFGQAPYADNAPLERQATVI
ncbi:MAG: glycosyltransferase family 2 protein [Dehalococcoidia bacterium]